jgi:hypothetical protein
MPKKKVIATQNLKDCLQNLSLKIRKEKKKIIVSKLIPTILCVPERRGQDLLSFLFVVHYVLQISFFYSPSLSEGCLPVKMADDSGIFTTTPRIR